MSCCLFSSCSLAPFHFTDERRDLSWENFSTWRRNDFCQCSLATCELGDLSASDAHARFVLVYILVMATLIVIRARFFVVMVLHFFCNFRTRNSIQHNLTRRFFVLSCDNVVSVKYSTKFVSLEKRIFLIVMLDKCTQSELCCSR